MKISTLAAAVALGAMFALPTQAAPIIGSISFADGFDAAGLPTAPSTSVVSALSTVDVNNVVNAYSPGSATGAFAGTTSATAFDLLPPALPTTFFTTDSGFTFTLTNLVVDSTSPLSCASGLCADEIAFSVSGVVSGGGFDDTLFLGSWTANGSCLGAAGSCDSDISASWSASLTATGQEVTVPEPGTIVLLSLGLVGAGFLRRRT